MKLCALLLAAMLCTLCVGQASALEYTMNAPDDYLFGTWLHVCQPDQCLYIRLTSRQLVARQSCPLPALMPFQMPA